MSDARSDLPPPPRGDLPADLMYPPDITLIRGGALQQPTTPVVTGPNGTALGSLPMNLTYSPSVVSGGLGPGWGAPSGWQPGQPLPQPVDASGTSTMPIAASPALYAPGTPGAQANVHFGGVPPAPPSAAGTDTYGQPSDTSAAAAAARGQPLPQPDTPVEKITAW